MSYSDRFCHKLSPSPGEAVFCLFALLTVAATAAALDVPSLEGRINDRAGLLDASARQQLEAKLAAYEQKTGHQFVLLTVPSLKGDALEDFSIRVAESWKIGHKKDDNGLLLIVAKKDRAMRVEVGYGLEGVIPDAIASRVIREVITPAFRQNDFAGGIGRGFDVLMRAGSGQKVDLPRTRPQRKRRGHPWWLDVLMLLFFLGAPPFLRLLGFASILGGHRRGYWGRRLRGPLVVGAASAVSQVAEAASGAAAPRGGGEAMSELLSEDEKKHVAEAVAEVEKRTAGEIVVAVVDQSDAYTLWRAGLAFILTVATAYLSVRVFHVLTGPVAIILQIPLLAMFGYASGLAPITRTLVPKAVMDTAVRERAFATFAGRGVHHTRDESGVLIFISELEHEVVILGDRGIHQRLGEKGWQGHVDAIVAGIQKGRTADVLIEEIRSFGQTLAQHFPARPDDVNELPNQVVS